MDREKVKSLLSTFSVIGQRIPGTELILTNPESHIADGVVPTSTVSLNLLPRKRITILFHTLSINIIYGHPKLFTRTYRPVGLIRVTTYKLPIITTSVKRIAELLSSHPSTHFPTKSITTLTGHVIYVLHRPEPLSTDLTRS